MRDPDSCLPNVFFLHQEWVNYGLQAKSSLLPVFIHNVLLERGLSLYSLLVAAFML